MPCAFCGSDSHDRENCPWNGTGKRMMLAVVLVLAVGCTAQKAQADEPRYKDLVWGMHIKAVMVECSRIVMVAVDAARAGGVVVTPAMMNKLYGQCLKTQRVTI